MLTEDIYQAGEVTINFGIGPENGPPLVLLHGSTLNWQTFVNIIPELSLKWQVFACDLRGHGKSSWADSGYRIVDFAPDTQTFIQD